MKEASNGTSGQRSPQPIPKWEEAAKRLLRVEMTKRGWRYQRLALELKLKLGVLETPAQLSRKINRGKFSAGFLLLCLEALGVAELRMEEVNTYVSGPSGSHPRTEKTTGQVDT